MGSGALRLHASRRPVDTDDLEEMYARSTSRLVRLAEWIVPFVASACVFGPALRPGGLFNLDLVVVPEVDMPASLSGYGPDVPSRLPLWGVVAALSRVVSAEWIAKALLVIGVAMAWIGMARLLRRYGPLAANSAGIVFGLSPFLLTRSSVGHFSVTLAAAVLPWALPALTRPGRDLRVTFVAATALGFTGPFGGSLAVLIVIAALLGGASDRWIRGAVVTLIGQLPWAVPAALFPNGAFNDTTSYPTRLNGLFDAVRLSVGDGFWLERYQVAGSGRTAAVVATVLLLLAFFGNRDLPAALRRPLMILGGFGWLVAVLSSIRLFDEFIASATSSPVTGLWREPQRLIVLHLLWLAPAATIGTIRLGREFHDCRVRQRAFFKAVPGALAVLLVAPSAWGINGQLAATPIPQDWSDVRVAVADKPGTVLALPWAQYLKVDLADGGERLVLHPLAGYLGGDVLHASSDDIPRGTPSRQTRRGELAGRQVEALQSGVTIGDELAELGIRWVVLLKTELVGEYRTLYRDPALVEVVDGANIVAFEVIGWKGPATTAKGREVSVRMLLPGVARVDSSKELTWNWPGHGGWRRGLWGSLTVSDDGRLIIPAGRGLLWQWRAVPSAASQVVWMIALLIGLNIARLRFARRGRRPSRRRQRFDTWDSLVRASR
jgi:hypothetical protein